MEVFALIILSSAGVRPINQIIFLGFQPLLYLVSIVVHEYAHLVCSRIHRIQARLYWQPRPSVECINPDPRFIRRIAISGPLAGVAVALVGIATLVTAGDYPAMLFANGIAISALHASMLLPIFPDGEILRATMRQ